MQKKNSTKNTKKPEYYFFLHIVFMDQYPDERLLTARSFDRLKLLYHCIHVVTISMVFTSHGAAKLFYKKKYLT